MFRVSLGAPDTLQQISLKPGWNMVSFAVMPLNNSVDDVFSNGTTKFYRGSVYEYQNGQYVEATSVTATKGYWVFAPYAVDFVVYGDHEAQNISLTKGWNIAGPVYKVNDFKTMYSNFTSIVNPDNIREFVNNGGKSDYAPIKTSDGKYPLAVGKAYWFYATEDVDLPVIPVE